MKEGPTFIDLFCGCGGLSKGFEDAGFEGLLAIDHWQPAVDTYNYNFKSHKAIIGDLFHADPNEIVIKYNLKDVDVIIGGPPCQGFSLAGKRLVTDERNELYKSFVRFVKELQPKAFVMENVPGIVGLFKGKVLESVLNDFTKVGYNVKYQILSADDYGVPQIRRRVFFVGLRKDLKGELSYPTGDYNLSGKPAITSKEAISDLDFIGDDSILDDVADYQKPAESEYQRFMRKDSDKLFNHVVTLHQQKTKDIIALVPDGGNYKDLPDELKDTRKVNIAWTRMNSQKPSFTIDTGHRHHFHYKANRVPTVRESARIQSFPDDFEFKGSKTAQAKQVGNAVPPLMARAVAGQLMKALYNLQN